MTETTPVQRIDALVAQLNAALVEANADRTQVVRLRILTVMPTSAGAPYDVTIGYTVEPLDQGGGRA